MPLAFYLGLSVFMFVVGILGVTLAGDHAKPGLAWLALLGVAMVLVGALDLARFSAELEGAVDEAS